MPELRSRLQSVFSRLRPLGRHRERGAAPRNCDHSQPAAFTGPTFVGQVFNLSRTGQVENLSSENTAPARQAANWNGFAGRHSPLEGSVERGTGSASRGSSHTHFRGATLFRTRGRGHCLLLCAGAFPQQPAAGRKGAAPTAVTPEPNASINAAATGRGSTVRLAQRPLTATRRAPAAIA